MRKTIVGYCDNCHKETKHNVIECEDSVGERVLENVLTLGLIGLIDSRRYKCECTKCGEINRLYK